MRIFQYKTPDLLLNEYYLLIWKPDRPIVQLFQMSMDPRQFIRSGCQRLDKYNTESKIQSHIETGEPTSK